MAEPRQPAQRSTLPSIEQEELRGISRTVAEIEWLLLVLVLVYLVFGWPLPEVEPAISMAMFFYAAFVMSFRYTNFYKRESRSAALDSPSLAQSSANIWCKTYQPSSVAGGKAAGMDRSCSPPACGFSGGS